MANPKMHINGAHDAPEHYGEEYEVPQNCGGWGTEKWLQVLAVVAVAVVVISIVVVAIKFLTREKKKKGFFVSLFS